MKPNLFAIAIPTLLISNAVSAIDISNYADTKIDLYGRVYAVHNNKDSDTSASSARIGLDASQQTLEEISVYSRFEWDASNLESTQAGIDNRYAFVGFKSWYNGSIDYGKNDGVLKLINDYTNLSDILPGFGGEAAKYTVLGDRTASLLTYTNENLFGRIKGFDIVAQYRTPNSKNASGISNENSDSLIHAMGINVQYALFNTGLKVGLGYAQSSVNYWDTDSYRNPDKTVFYDGYNQSRMAGIKYDKDKLYLAAIYNQTKMHPNTEDTNTYTGYEFVAKYGYDLDIGRLTPSVAYVYHKITNTNTALAKYVAMGAQYDLNKHISVLLDYKINLLKEAVTDSDTTENQIALGFIYNF